MTFIYNLFGIKSTKQINDRLDRSTSYALLNLSATIWEQAAEYVELNPDKSHEDMAEFMRHVAGGLRMHETL